jgi:hypothetical protein
LDNPFLLKKRDTEGIFYARFGLNDKSIAGLMRCLHFTVLSAINPEQELLENQPHERGFFPIRTQTTVVSESVLSQCLNDQPHAHGKIMFSACHESSTTLTNSSHRN